ncbi:50S ribosome-binding GTPase [Dactylosporangium vinaceum]|uniref:GTPase n=1 Tax=Dactylosporangium vinaceum TaxID=53362 RepID=A0ABV5MCZ8_9ACTN|nr:GTPase [Dactylosporangium vinaceum]UAC00783.1 50S ribosome-binding GTPase [Dactylosporangium vinaceum]
MVDVQADLQELIDQHRAKLPKNRRPCVLVCGAMGSGKTTTINTLFGADVGAVGHFSRGTAADEVYEWEARGEHIQVVDLPGLGDSKERDREYREMYRRRVEQAHGFIVVTTPPRPAGIGTLRTVKLLLECGVPPQRIVIAYNRLALLNIEIDGELQPLEMAGIGGPLEPEGLARIEEARRALLADLREGTHNQAFTLGQIVAFDALSGWNLYGVLDAVLVGLPGDTLPPWRDAVGKAAERAIERQHKRSERDRKRIAELEARLQDLDERQRKEYETRKKKDDLNKSGGTKMIGDKDRHERGIVDRFADAAERWTGSKPLGNAIRVTGAVLKGMFS